MATVIKKATCPACECPDAEWREAKAGAATIYCPACRFQGFAKSPKASSAVRSAGGSTEPAPKPEKKGWLDEL